MLPRAAAQLRSPAAAAGSSLRPLRGSSGAAELLPLAAAAERCCLRQQQRSCCAAAVSITYIFFLNILYLSFKHSCVFLNNFYAFLQIFVICFSTISACLFVYVLYTFLYTFLCFVCFSVFFYMF